MQGLEGRKVSPIIGRKELASTAILKGINVLSDPDYSQSSKAISPTLTRKNKKKEEISSPRFKFVEPTKDSWMKDSIFYLSFLKSNPSLIDSKEKIPTEQAIIYHLAEGVKEKLKERYGNSVLDHNMRALSSAIEEHAQQTSYSAFDLNKVNFISDGTGIRDSWIKLALDTDSWRVPNFDNKEILKESYFQIESEELVKASPEEKKKWLKEIEDYSRHVESSNLGPKLAQINDDYESLLYECASRQTECQFDSIYNSGLDLMTLSPTLDNISNLDTASIKLDVGLKRLSTEAAEILFSYNSQITEALESRQHHLKIRSDFDDSIFSTIDKEAEKHHLTQTNIVNNNKENGTLERIFNRKQKELIKEENESQVEKDAIEDFLSEATQMVEQFESTYRAKSIHLTMELIWEDLSMNSLKASEITPEQSEMFNTEYQELNSDEKLMFWTACSSIMFGTNEQDWRSKLSEGKDAIKAKFSNHSNIGGKTKHTTKDPEIQSVVSQFRLNEDQVLQLESSLVKEVIERVVLKKSNVPPVLDYDDSDIVREMYMAHLTNHEMEPIVSAGNNANMEDFLNSLHITYQENSGRRGQSSSTKDIDAQLLGSSYGKLISILEYNQLRESVYNVSNLLHTQNREFGSFISSMGSVEEIKHNQGEVNKVWKKFLKSTFESVASKYNATNFPSFPPKDSGVSRGTTKGRHILEELNRRNEKINAQTSSGGTRNSVDWGAKDRAIPGKIENWENTSASFWKPFVMMIKEDLDLNKRHILGQELEVTELHKAYLEFEKRHGNTTPHVTKFEDFVNIILKPKSASTQTGQLKRKIDLIVSKITLSDLNSAIEIYSRNKAQRELIILYKVYSMARLILNDKYTKNRWIIPIQDHWKRLVEKHKLQKDSRYQSISAYLSSFIDIDIGNPFFALFSFGMLSLLLYFFIAMITKKSNETIAGFIVPMKDVFKRVPEHKQQQFNPKTYSATKSDFSENDLKNMASNPDIPKWCQSVKPLESGLSSQIIVTLFNNSHNITGKNDPNYFDLKLIRDNSALNDDYIKGLNACFGSQSIAYQYLQENDKTAAAKLLENFEKTGFHKQKAEVYLKLDPKDNLWSQFNDQLKQCYEIVKTHFVNQISNEYQSVSQAGQTCNQTKYPNILQILGNSGIDQYSSSRWNILHWIRTFLSNQKMISKDMLLSNEGEPVIPRQNSFGGRDDISQSTEIDKMIHSSPDLLHKVNCHTSFVISQKLPGLQYRNLISKVNIESDRNLGEDIIDENYIRKEKLRLHEEDKRKKLEEKRKKGWNMGIKIPSVTLALVSTFVALNAGGVVSLGPLIGEFAGRAVTNAILPATMGWICSNWDYFRGSKNKSAQKTSMEFNEVNQAVFEWFMKTFQRGVMFPIKSVFWVISLGLISSQLEIRSILNEAISSNTTPWYESILPNAGSVTCGFLMAAYASNLVENYVRFSIIKENKERIDDYARGASNTLELLTFASKEGWGGLKKWLDPNWILHALKEGNLNSLVMFAATSLAEYNSMLTHNILLGKEYKGLPIDIYGNVVTGGSPISQFSVGQLFHEGSDLKAVIPVGWWSIVPGVWMMLKQITVVLQNNIYADTQTLYEVQHTKEGVKNDVNYYSAHYTGWRLLSHLIPRGISEPDLENMRDLLIEIRKIRGDFDYLETLLEANAAGEIRQTGSEWDEKISNYNELNRKMTSGLNGQRLYQSVLNSIIDYVGSAWLLGYFIEISSKTFSFNELPNREDVIQSIRNGDFSQLQSQKTAFMTDSRGIRPNEIPGFPDVTYNESREADVKTFVARATALVTHVSKYNPHEGNSSFSDVSFYNTTENVMGLLRLVPNVLFGSLCSSVAVGALAYEEIWAICESLGGVLRKWKRRQVERFERNEQERLKIYQNNIDIINNATERDTGRKNQ